MVVGKPKLSDLSIYHEKILQLASFNKKSIDLHNFNSSFKLKNPMCGDEVHVKVLLQQNEIKKISAKVRGCALCEASAGLVLKIFNNEKLPIKNFLSDYKNWLNDESMELLPSLPNEISVFFPIKPIKNRHTCIIIPFKAMFKALDKMSL